MSRPFLLPLSDTQVQMVALQGHPLLRILLRLAGGENTTGWASSRDLSRSLLHALAVLAAVCQRPNTPAAAIAEEVGLSKSSTGRYLKTWEAVGVLERDPRTHRHRLAACWDTAAGRRP